ncbi:LANO_0H12178g1_1 [Lachancea nothofagi CBS 11611]|uniref:Large ribosomal subunit protein uL4m n=1 Tax=Lachancea nothofagi CBS 11611 TaxID=1266666 RepID=A0A1G4KMC3_9SACH|nr:LANO_0H12178g1_1 [Lachancea nothofagi CBS 11611]
MSSCGTSRLLLRSIQSIRFQSSHSAAQVLPHASLPPVFTLATLRSFPSLEPLTFVPVPATVFDAPLRRDLLWKAVVYENDNKRVGSSNPPSRSENGYSRRKLLPQKGSGKARAGDANSPTRHNGSRALARSAPNDYTTKLPQKAYSQAIINALSYQYRRGNIYVIGGANPLCETHDLDLNELEILPTSLEHDNGDLVFEKFLETHDLTRDTLLFIVNAPRAGLFRYTEPFKDDVNIVQKEFVDVNDILKARRIFVELEALEYLAVTHTV